MKTKYRLGGVVYEIHDCNLVRDRNLVKSGDPIKRVLVWKGIEIGISHEKGDMRHGRRLKAAYGHVRGTYGVPIEVKAGKGHSDGMSWDVWLGPDLGSDKVFAIEQIKPDTGEIDEYKLVLGTHTKEEATDLYLSVMPKRFYADVHNFDLKKLLEYSKNTASLTKAPKAVPGQMGLFDAPAGGGGVHHAGGGGEDIGGHHYQGGQFTPKSDGGGSAAPKAGGDAAAKSRKIASDQVVKQAVEQIKLNYHDPQTGWDKSEQDAYQKAYNSGGHKAVVQRVLDEHFDDDYTHDSRMANVALNHMDWGKVHNYMNARLAGEQPEHSDGPEGIVTRELAVHANDHDDDNFDTEDSEFDPNDKEYQKFLKGQAKFRTQMSSPESIQSYMRDHLRYNNDQFDLAQSLGRTASANHLDHESISNAVLKTMNLTPNNLQKTAMFTVSGVAYIFEGDRLVKATKAVPGQMSLFDAPADSGSGGGVHHAGGGGEDVNGHHYKGGQFTPKGGGGGSAAPKASDNTAAPKAQSPDDEQHKKNVTGVVGKHLAEHYRDYYDLGTQPHEAEQDGLDPNHPGMAWDEEFHTKMMEHHASGKLGEKIRDEINSDDGEAHWGLFDSLARNSLNRVDWKVVSDYVNKRSSGPTEMPQGVNPETKASLEHLDSHIEMLHDNLTDADPNETKYYQAELAELTDKAKSPDSMRKHLARRVSTSRAGLDEGYWMDMISAAQDHVNWGAVGNKVDKQLKLSQSKAYEASTGRKGARVVPLKKSAIALGGVRYELRGSCLIRSR